MTDLTEQLKKGELPSDLYYIKDSNDNIYTDECVRYDNNERDAFIFAGTEVREVLSKVPNYKEFLALQSDSLAKNEATEIIAELESENTKLKELLKECQSKLNYCTRETYKLQTKIKQALGEDK